MSVVILILAFALVFLFFFNDTATTEIYTLSLHDALPICSSSGWVASPARPKWRASARSSRGSRSPLRDRKSTRLNSSHQIISYAVFCLKKKTKSLSSQHAVLATKLGPIEAVPSSRPPHHA